MGHYVYRYMHPDYPWLYVGKTDVDLKQRIRQHTYSGDNIPRKYESLLNESSIYYIELDNSLQTTYIEKLLIDKYKPFLNKADIIQDAPCPVEFTLPKWKKFESLCNLSNSDSKINIDADTEKALKKLRNELKRINADKTKEKDIDVLFAELSKDEQRIVVYFCKCFLNDSSLVHTISINKLINECNINITSNAYNVVRDIMQSLRSRGFYMRHFNTMVYSGWVEKVTLQRTKSEITVGISVETATVAYKLWNEHKKLLKVV